MRFILTGFTQESGVRVFAFEKVAEDLTRTMYSVRADLALSRKYDIRTQDLPLLCRVLLERRGSEEHTQTFIFTEQEMSDCAKESAANRRVSSSKRNRRGFHPSNPATDPKT